MDCNLTTAVVLIYEYEHSYGEGGGNEWFSHLKQTTPFTNSNNYKNYASAVNSKLSDSKMVSYLLTEPRFIEGIDRASATVHDVSVYSKTKVFVAQMVRHPHGGFIYTFCTRRFRRFQKTV